MNIPNAEIRIAIDMLDFDTARRLVRDKLKVDADADTYYLAALVAVNDNQKRTFLQKAVDEDPFHQEAHEELEKMNGAIHASPTMQEIQVAAPAPQIAPEPISEIEVTTVSVVEPEPSFVKGRIKSGQKTASIHVIPIETGIVRTNLREGAEVILFGRDAHMGWLEVLYQSPIGQPVFGWIATENVDNININGTPVAAIDLPISQFQLNRREEVQVLIGELKKSAKSIEVSGRIVPLAGRLGIAYLAWCAVLVIGLLALLLTIGILTNNDTNRGDAFIVGGFGIVMTALGWNRVSNNKLIHRFIVARDTPIHARIRNLNMQQLSMRTEYERMRDDERTTFAFSTAMNLGANLLTTAAGRMIKDRREVTNININK